MTDEEELWIEQIERQKAAIEERTEAQKLAQEGVLERAEAARELAQEIIDAEQTIMQDNFDFQIGLIEEQAARFLELEMDSVAVKTWSEGEKLKLAMDRYDQENKMMSHFSGAYTTFMTSLTDTAMHGADRYDRVLEAMKSGMIKFFGELIVQGFKQQVAKQAIAAAEATARAAALAAAEASAALADASAIGRSAVTGKLIAANYATAAAMAVAATSGGSAVLGGAALTHLITSTQAQAMFAAEGADFITSGPQLVVVGDNPGGREHVQVTPIDSPGPNAPSGGNITINISAPLVDETVIDSIIPAIQRAQRMNLA